MAVQEYRGDLHTTEQLIRAVANQLRSPLLQINQQAQADNNPADMMLLSARALQYIDYFLLGSENQTQLDVQVQPVSLSALLTDVAHDLSGVARQFDCNLEVRISGSYPPVMADTVRLRAALMSLGYGLIEGLVTEKPRVILGAHKGNGGLITGAFTNETELSADMLKRAKYLFGRASQPFDGLVGSGTSIAVADALFHQMDSSLQIARHNKLAGLAAKLIPSQQLQLV